MPPKFNPPGVRNSDLQIMDSRPIFIYIPEMFALTIVPLATLYLSYQSVDTSKSTPLIACFPVSPQVLITIHERIDHIS